MVTALYRRYRPETFAEMIGQSQVTEPLMTALRTDRVNHAYLFSGPRGCGKTTSARILARCLNCAEGPTDTPCGVCPSCVELSRAGGGSLDVVEIDAASHNGVDDARDLRERAVFAPARDRFKIFILDEAHMVTPQGFNALLKLVEEPPEHVKFIFATTEPDKVLGTIRSRTHHYPFRLVPPAPMLDYVQKLCDEEGVQVEPGVLSLVVRAGGGSPRDTLSLLDQLIAGSEGSTVGYERAVALLGYTHGALLDDVVESIGAADAARAFAAADRVMQTGQDPRRFVEDLLERLRDLIVVAATTPEAAAAVLRGVPADELARMATQASVFGAAELSRVADLVNQTLTEMTGATSPRLHLELMLARVLVPSSDETERGALARVERLERRVGVTDASGDGAAPAPSAAPTSAPAAAAVAPEVRAAPEKPVAERPASTAPPKWETPATEPTTAAARAAGPAAAAPQASIGSSDAPAAEPTRPVGPVTVEQMRDAWPEVLSSLQRTKRSAWMVAFTAQVLDYRDDDVLVLGFPSESDMGSFRSGPPGQSVGDLLRAAIAEVLGVRVKFLARVVSAGGGADRGPAAPPSAGSPAGDGGRAPAAPASPPPAAATRPEGTTGAPAPAQNAPAPAQNAPAPRSAAGSTSSPATPVASGGPVDSWATVAIPASDPAVAGAEATTDAASAPAARSAARTAVAERPAPPAPASSPTVADDDVPPLDDADAPPLEPEPDDAPGLEGDAHGGPSTAPAPRGGAAARGGTAPRGAAARGGARAPSRSGQGAPGGAAPSIQRYGEAVVRDLLGATFLEEVEAPQTRFGERG
ncbi:DNA polymerase III subunit gamma and tau [Agromyces luteolus]|uniref:DNA-directed DNA polymerase n=3 Tax=Agromyces luteolus TaxID=88373 RepID=A0A7C9HSN3_9MICO|nr:DNA polymerase III subunit gamma and tau [Agromyces luteolus]